MYPPPAFISYNPGRKRPCHNYRNIIAYFYGIQQGKHKNKAVLPQTAFIDITGIAVDKLRPLYSIKNIIGLGNKYPPFRLVPLDEYKPAKHIKPDNSKLHLTFPLPEGV
jgi:hypothetical protein